MFRYLADSIDKYGAFHVMLKIFKALGEVLAEILHLKESKPYLIMFAAIYFIMSISSWIADY